MHAFAQGGDDLVPTLRAQLDKKINTWDIQVAYNGFKRGQYTLVPRYPYSTNIGTQGEGTHVADSRDKHPTLYIDLSLALEFPRLPEKIVIDEKILRSLRAALVKYTPKPSLWQRVLNKFKKYMK